MQMFYHKTKISILGKETTKKEIVYSFNDIIEANGLTN